jgi:hypothetical protein
MLAIYFTGDRKWDGRINHDVLRDYRWGYGTYDR